MGEAFFDTPLYREFAQLEEFGRLPDESTILRFRHRLEKHKLAEQILGVVNELLTTRGLLLKPGTVVYATLIAAPSSTKNKEHKRDPEMHPSKKSQQMYFGMKAHIGVDADSGLVHTVRGTSGNVHDVTEGNSLLHVQETDAFGDAGYQGIEKRPDANADVNWHVAMKPGKRNALNKDNAIDAMVDQVEKIKASIRSKVEHPFRVVKRQFGYVKVRYRGLKKHGPVDDLVCVVKPVDYARQIDANAVLSASKNAAKCLKGQKSQRNAAKNGVMAEVFTQKITASNNQAAYSNR